MSGEHGSVADGNISELTIAAPSGIGFGRGSTKCARRGAFPGFVANKHTRNAHEEPAYEARDRSAAPVADVDHQLAWSRS